MTAEWLPIQYRDFWDVPRLLAFQDGDEWFMLDCQFDDVGDGYPDIFRILRIRDDDVPLLVESDWSDLPGRADFLGVIDVADVVFDPTRRSAISKAILTRVRSM